ncbi:hypothetical protein V495_06074 [Pseudogymnoascus sp. VKM F-4514 (FW-929)]|nr:hypothetical protein V495_06074 [Pseudogymnoascus sp. VKM F-4514 (FW-929)]KFY54667.1 hypothetical protein V497_07531 [Pseudogymnoascus sp. VKM F-4516 (FW-969)]
MAAEDPGRCPSGRSIDWNGRAAGTATLFSSRSTFLVEKPFSSRSSVVATPPPTTVFSSENRANQPQKFFLKMQGMRSQDMA